MVDDGRPLVKSGYEPSAGSSPAGPTSPAVLCSGVTEATALRETHLGVRLDGAKYARFCG